MASLIPQEDRNRSPVLLSRDANVSTAVGLTTVHVADAINVRVDAPVEFRSAKALQIAGDWANSPKGFEVAVVLNEHVVSGVGVGNIDTPN